MFSLLLTERSILSCVIEGEDSGLVRKVRDSEVYKSSGRNSGCIGTCRAWRRLAASNVGDELSKLFSLFKHGSKVIAAVLFSLTFISLGMGGGVMPRSRSPLKTN